jgi:hypothetical protein
MAGGRRTAMWLMTQAERIERWHVDAVRTYLSRAFGAARVEDYPRGASVAHLFVVTEPGQRRGQAPCHNLLVTRQFFSRFTDGHSVAEGLDAAEVAQQLKRAGERTVELY